MLRSFRVENHKSIKDEQELSLLPAYDKSKPVVPVAAIFGANASGKSNLLDALRWLQNAVRTSYAAWEAGSGIPRTPFRLDPKAVEAPSGYAVEIAVDGERYSYGVEVDSERVRSEWLYTYPHNRRRAIFERDDKGLRLGSTVPDYRARAESLDRQTRPNALFLGVAAQNELAEADPAFQWFRKAVVFGDAGEVLQDEVMARLRDERGRASILALVRAADLGITDVTVSDSATERLAAELVDDLVDRGLVNQEILQNTRADLRRLVEAAFDRPLMEVVWDKFSQIRDGGQWITHPRLLFHHGQNAVGLGLEDQSAGTKSWLALVSHALAVIHSGDLLVVDEVDASLHPHLSARLIDLFRDQETNPRGAQLVFTTHDATLLDEEMLSRDEVWFVEKDADTGATRLYPLTDFHPRKHENTEGRYLAGGYGAIPILSGSDFREAFRPRRGPDEAT
ncbi:ATP-binding protein [Phytohabitans flavus]|uniref:ATPase AAA-type core domain-containing protein n=1 Tax=Phytohabitans flavus TaxID=1076124 RepID=A0A6F8XQJ0_9ACTN|nr:ATP-binding protein [Phytohabitans flavus]BCB76059.1 hypothetical protein Pflav_024690 [Phytohabitans flavus]